jgi:integrase/recombinase XerD
MKRVGRLYLPYADWPQQDRVRWEAAFRAGRDLFDDHGAGAHLAERTRRQLQYAYGKFLAFLRARHGTLLALPPAERLNSKIIRDYVKWQPRTCGGITLSVYLFHLWFALRYLCPGDDWAWLLAISKRIRDQAKRKPQQQHLVTSELLYSLGIQLMDRALASGKPATSWRVQTGVRDGLMIALLALIPLRRRTLSALRIGKHLVRSGDQWVLDIPASDIKNKRPLEYPLSAELSERVDIYLNQVRLQITGAGTHDYLWASCRGRRMSDAGIYGAVRRRTRKYLGFSVNLHRFRRAAATFWSVRDPVNVRGAKDLLGHASFATTETHYIMAQSRLAGRALAQAISETRAASAASRRRANESTARSSRVCHQ